VPVYEYGCTVCGRPIEVRHGVHSHGPTICGECGGQMRKLVSAPTIVFKGSGWAKKDRQATSGPAPSRTTSNSAGTGGETSTGGSAPASGEGPATPAAPTAATPAPSGGSTGD
jgi:putative FmdB family regulatory protein